MTDNVLPHASRLAAAIDLFVCDNDGTMHKDASVLQKLRSAWYGLLREHLRADPTWPDAERFLDYFDSFKSVPGQGSEMFAGEVSWWPQGNESLDDDAWWPADREPMYQRGVPYMQEPVVLIVLRRCLGTEEIIYEIRFGRGSTYRVFSNE